MFDKTKIDRFTKLLEGYQLDINFVNFYNEVLNQFEISERYISELEMNNMQLMLHNGEKHVTEIQWQEYCLMKSQYHVRMQLRDISKLFKEKGYAVN